MRLLAYDATLGSQSEQVMDAQAVLAQFRRCQHEIVRARLQRPVAHSSVVHRHNQQQRNIRTGRDPTKLARKFDGIEAGMAHVQHHEVRLVMGGPANRLDWAHWPGQRRRVFRCRCRLTQQMAISLRSADYQDGRSHRAPLN